MTKPQCPDCKVEMFIKTQDFADEMEDVFQRPKCKQEMTREEYEEQSL